MSKGLEALEKISKVDYCFLEGELDGFFGMFSEEYNIIKTELQRLMVYDIQKEQTDKVLETLRKEHKALEIIKKYPKWKGSIRFLRYMANYWKEHNIIITKERLENHDFPFEVEEFNLLVEVFK